MVFLYFSVHFQYFLFICMYLKIIIILWFVRFLVFYYNYFFTAEINMFTNTTHGHEFDCDKLKLHY